MIRHALAHMLSCKDVSRLLSRQQEQPLSAFTRWRLKLHLAACDGCAGFSRQVDFLREAMRRYRS